MGLRRGSIGIGPKRSTGNGIERNDVVRGLDGIHNAVHNKRRRLELLHRGGLEYPLKFELIHVVGSNLVERAVALARVRSRISEPVLRLPVGVQNAVVGYLREKRSGNQK